MGSRRIAIVGAGPSGLVTAKELLQEGHRVTCFEKTDSLGGIFNFRPDGDAAGVWETCRLTSSILVTSFSDYFPSWESPVPYEHRHWTHHEYLEYLGKYAAHFDLLPHIRFGCDVMDVSPRDGGRWLVTVRNAERGEKDAQVFDAVAICSGIHRVPFVPEIPGMEGFRGQLIHSAHYKNPRSLRGQSAVFIGAGESGEIIAEASRNLNQCYLSLRRGVFVIPRLLNGLPNDYAGTRLLYSLPAFVSRRSDLEAKRLRRRLALALFPLWILRTVLVHGRKVLITLLKGKKQDSDPRQEQIEALIQQLRAQAGGNQFETFATKTEAFIEAVVDGRCELRPGIKRITPTGVVFEDGAAVQVDTIMFCTGYKAADVPFLRVPVDLKRLYKNCFDPNYRETLAFVGFIRPPIGAIPPMSEFQARWLAQLLSGNVHLPSAAEMRSRTEEELANRQKYYHQVFDRLPHLVDFSTYIDELAGFIDCKPRLLDFIKTPRLLYKLHAGPFCGAQYRFRGPHARPEMATKVILHSPAHAPAVRFLDVALAEIAGLLGLTRFQPHLSLIGSGRRSSRNGVV